MACTLNIFKVVLKTKVILLSVLKCFRLNNKNNYSTLHRVLMSNQFTFWVFHLLAKWSKMFCKHTLWAWSHHLILVCLADYCWKHLAVGYSLLWLQRQSLGQISLKSMRDQKLPNKSLIQYTDQLWKYFIDFFCIFCIMFTCRCHDN